MIKTPPTNSTNNNININNYSNNNYNNIDKPAELTSFKESGLRATDLVSLPKIMGDRVGMVTFRNFLKSVLADENLQFWKDVVAFKECPSDQYAFITYYYLLLFINLLDCVYFIVFRSAFINAYYAFYNTYNSISLFFSLFYDDCLHFGFHDVNNIMQESI